MTESQIKGFRSHMDSVRRSSGYKFHVNMDELQTTRLVQHVNLDPENDAPLPLWAKQIVETPHLSRRTRVELLRFHDSKIRETRLAMAKPVHIQQ